MTNKLISKKIYSFKIKLISGLHIGDSSETIQIGGIDNPVIRRRDNRQPYIPGSSLKGKIRSLLEMSEGKNLGGSDVVNKVFGTHNNKNNTIPSRIIFRDIYLTKESVENLQKNENLDLEFTEAKYENSVDRITAVANPRPLERVPAGCEFEGTFVLNVFHEGLPLIEMEELIYKGILLLNNDFLGGSGSRGSGQVELHSLKLEKEIKIQ